MRFFLRRQRHLIFLAILFIWASRSYVQTSIQGRIVDTEANPLEYVEVIVKPTVRGDVSDENGYFQIAGLPGGSHIVSFRLLGYQPIKKALELSESGEPHQINIVMTPTVIELGDVLVTASRNLTSPEEVPQFVSVINPRKIRERNVRQTPELLREEPGLVVQKTNQGGGSPIIRGLKANKLLLLIDGIRLNNSTYRGGNTQYLNSVDSGALDRVEIVHGPISVMYGSDALGGAINLITRTPWLHSTRKVRFSGSVATSISTADETQSLHLNLTTANSRWGLVLDGSFKSFGDVTRGSNGGSTLMQRLQNDSRTKRVLNKEQSPNAYDTFDFSSKALIKLSDLQDLTLAFQMNRQDAVPRYDVVETLRDSIRLFDPQERDLYFVTYKNIHQTALFDLFTATLSVHRQFERRKRQRFGRTTLTTDDVRTLTTGLQSSFHKLFGNAHELVYGMELYFDDVATESSSRNTLSGAKTQTTPLFPDGSSFLTLGIFFQDAVQVVPRWTLTPGLRFSATRLKAPFENTSDLATFGEVNQSTSALTGSLGSMYRINDRLSFVGNIAQGFRTPNLDDISKSGLGKGSSFFDIPNPDAGPEESLSLDGGFKIHSNRVRASAFGFYNHINDLLVRRPAEFKGSSFIVEDGDSLAVFRKENAGSAFTTGFAVDTEVSINPNLALRANLTYTVGQNTTDDEPLTGVPPFSGLLGLRWRRNHSWAEFNTRFAAAQSRLALEDRQDLRIPEGGTPGWYTVNFRFGADISRVFSFTISMHNLLDRNYREHLSGFNAPGRNFVFSARFKQ